MKKEIDKAISALILIAFAAIWIIYWIVSKSNVPPDVTKWVAITRDGIQGLMYLVILFNALGWSKNPIMKLVFLAITLFLLFCLASPYFPPEWNLNLPVPYLF